jgi:uncharacterized protein YjbJ (UPF0337 family)
MAIPHNVGFLMEQYATHVACRSTKLQSAARKETVMDEDQIKGSLIQAKGALKEAAGKFAGDAKMESEGKAEKTAGKIQNAVGGAKAASETHSILKTCDNESTLIDQPVTKRTLS